MGPRLPNSRLPRNRWAQIEERQAAASLSPFCRERSRKRMAGGPVSRILSGARPNISLRAGTIIPLGSDFTVGVEREDLDGNRIKALDSHGKLRSALAPSRGLEKF